jgi:hypothetical protein
MVIKNFMQNFYDLKIKKFKIFLGHLFIKLINFSILKWDDIKFLN